MAKKYLSLDEAAAKLGVSQEALKKAREKGDLRGFADRGNWKFREEDLEEYGRQHTADSDPDVPVLAPDLELDFGGSDQSVFSGDDDIGEQPTIIRKAGDSNVLSEESDLNLFDVGDEGASDSSVRLMLDDSLMKPSDSSKIKGGKQVLSDSSNVIGKKKSASDSSRILTDDDSSKDIPVSFGDSSSEHDLEGGSSSDIPISFGDSSQDLVLAIDDDDDDNSAHALPGMGDSDSDVRLAVDYEDAKLSDSNSEINLGGADSDSDVRLLDKTQPMKLDFDSDSDVRLIKTDSDSDVRMVGDQSDSDVRLLPTKRGPRPDSDSDVSLAGSDRDIPLAIADSDDEDLSGDGFVIGEGSDIKLGSDSGIKLESEGDSGISLDLAGDSGIALDTGTDSDISLAVEDDDGITLDTAGDSGIALDLPDDSGLSLDGASMEKTAPLLKMSGKGKKPRDDSATLVQMPTYEASDGGDESDTDFELGTLEGDSGSSDTSVLLFDDEDDADDRGATMIKKKAKEPEHTDETFDLEGGDEFEDDASEELMGEDDELEDEGGEDFLADDEDFESEDEGGESVEGATTTAVKMVAVEQEWGGLVFAVTVVSALLMVLAGGVMFDLVRYNWRAGDYGVIAGPLIDMLGIK